MSKFTFCVIISVWISFACSDQNFPEVFKRQASKEEFNMLITEEGKKYREKVTFDMTKKTVVHDVPAHRNISKSNVMVDFVSNSTVTRVLNERVCYIRSKSPEEPSLDVLKKSMDMVSSGKYKMKAGFRVITTQWRLKGLADLSKLSNEVIDFCRGMHIYEVEQYSRDGARVVKTMTRNKRTTSVSDGVLYVLCRPWEQVQNDLKRCPKSQWILKCKFTTQNCFHYVTCTHGSIDFRDGVCTSTHKFDDFTCCTPACP